MRRLKLYRVSEEATGEQARALSLLNNIQRGGAERLNDSAGDRKEDAHWGSR